MNYRNLQLFIFALSTLVTQWCTAAPDNNITVIGVGRLGLCTALCLEQAGYNVLGVDVSPDYVAKLNNKTLTSPEPGVDDLLKKSVNFRATCSLDEALEFSDLYFIIIATPSTNKVEAYDHSALSKLLSNINKRQVKNKHIVIGCTIFPGYIRQVASFLLRDCENTTLSYNPEFIAQGNIIYGFQHPDMVLIGEGSSEAGDRLEAMYHRCCKNTPAICRMSPESAEITKLAVNCFITTKIAYANMIGDIADRTPSADKFTILKAVGKDLRIGSKCLIPGYGFGGPCFPRDNRALGSYAQTLGIHPIIPQATDASNALHAQLMIEQCMESDQNEYIFEEVNYKPNCPVVILEESQKLVVASTLAKNGKRVIIRDNASVIAQVQEEFGNLFEYEITQ